MPKPGKRRKWLGWQMISKPGQCKCTPSSMKGRTPSLADKSNACSSPGLSSTNRACSSSTKPRVPLTIAPQSLVSERLTHLQATRVVIAHRLSTIINADQIYVFETGRIVQQGTYHQLINRPGPFADLAQRQLT